MTTLFPQLQVEHPIPIVVMGVAGCGKSSLGRACTGTLGWPLIEGDDHHPPANLAKMCAGIALTDADRIGWLDVLAGLLVAHARQGGAVLTCSSLKRSYRDRLRSAAPGLRFIWLDIDQATALSRVRQRAGTHPFPPSLVASQFAALESPAGEPGVLRLDGRLALARLAEQVIAWLDAGR